MFLLLLAASAAAPNIPDRHFYLAHWTVNNASTCVDARSRDVLALKTRLHNLEALARRKGLRAEIERQMRELHDMYMSALLIPCAGGKRKAFPDARGALRDLDRFIASK
jgi:hypothetical protein